jgi:hypothetical protein
MDLREIGLGVCGLDSTGSGQGPVAGCCECGDEPLGSCATELVIYKVPEPYFDAVLVTTLASAGHSNDLDA